MSYFSNDLKREMISLVLNLHEWVMARHGEIKTKDAQCARHCGTAKTKQMGHDADRHYYIIEINKKRSYRQASQNIQELFR